MAEMVADFLVEAEVSAKVGAEPYGRSEDRATHRNGTRDRRWDTRLGTLFLKVPKVREGGYVPSFIAQRAKTELAVRRPAPGKESGRGSGKHTSEPVTSTDARYASETENRHGSRRLQVCAVAKRTVGVGAPRQNGTVRPNREVG